MTARSDAIVIGAGFFGLRIALYLREELGLARVTVIEAESTAMERASYVNQARVHHGYHYPRSILTAYRSRVSSRAWSDEHSPALYTSFRHFYAIASTFSKVNARQFETFCERIGAPLSEVRPPQQAWFSPGHIEKAWEVEEFAFDARVLRTLMLDRVARAGGVEILHNRRVARIESSGSVVSITTADGDVYCAPLAISSVYASTNELHRSAGLPLIPLQLEITEMALVRVPDQLRNAAITVMDGPFFSLMPFPARGLHTLSHVRYTPHARWFDSAEAPDPRPIASRVDLAAQPSNFRPMIADARRYVPSLADLEYVDSVTEVKAVLRLSDASDSRPILVRNDAGIDGYYYVLGAKIDNVDDVLEELSHALVQHGRGVKTEVRQ
ncbi:FAD-dependent oxidoreductase [Demequina sediminis]|uniref:FAD-dependent oxidoreductase n=1 Tax=Demequina sediminis TaxID=1930058 RepID=UPI002572C3B6|nr:FAD-binding oxidoreductase [Demequina sediminis]BDZ62016.1 hypothetical protein GCM10025873_18070 [Demequina sediminis]